jgi:hypothetical protein
MQSVEVSKQQATIKQIIQDSYVLLNLAESTIDSYELDRLAELINKLRNNLKLIQSLQDC